ncbi:MAG: GxxExxY protein [Patescibacteria group bacterium]
MRELIYPELSYKLVGMAYKIDNEIGFGQNEKIYSDVFESLLKDTKLEYKRELYCPLKLDDKVIAKRYFDFLVEEKIIIEFKSGTQGYRDACTQIFQYLKSSGIKLGLVFRFTKNGVKIKRIPCFN